MLKAFWIVTVAVALTLGTAAMSSAADQAPPGGQSGSQLNSLDSQAGSPSEAGKTGIGSTSGTDASVNSGLKSTSQPVPCQNPGMRSETDTKIKADQSMKTEQSMEKKSAADAAREAMANVKTADPNLGPDTARNPDARSSAETTNRMNPGC
jgi:hypothetical protein